jgi:hypothetical protein
MMTLERFDPATRTVIKAVTIIFLLTTGNPDIIDGIVHFLMK